MIAACICTLSAATQKLWPCHELCVALPKTLPPNRASMENGWQFPTLYLNKVIFLGRATSTGAGSVGAPQQWLHGREIEMAKGEGGKWQMEAVGGSSGWKLCMEVLLGSSGWKFWMEAVDGSSGWKLHMEAVLVLSKLWDGRTSQAEPASQQQVEKEESRTKWNLYPWGFGKVACGQT